MATSGATLYSIYNRLSSAPEYHPFSADTFSDWSMEAGDIIRVSRDGKHYDSPVHTSQMTWRGQSQISVSSDGNEKRESIAKATKRKYGRGGSGYRNDNHLWQELLDDYNGLYSFFEVTSSRMRVEFRGMYDGLSSDFEVTRSRMYVDFQGMYDGLSSEFEVTRSRMRVEFRGMYDGLSSDFEVTRSRMYVDFQGMYDGLSSEFEVTRSRMRVEFRGMYDGLSSDFEVTRSRMAADFQGKYDGLASSFEVTRSRMAADFQGKYDGLASSFEVTRSRMAADFQGKYDGLSSEFEVTRSRFHVDLVDSYNQLSSGIEAAANYAMLYAESRTSKAEIIARINSKTGQSETLINAENIIIGQSGNSKITLNDRVKIDQSGNLYISGNIAMDLTGSNYLQTKEIRLIGASSTQGGKQSILTDSNIHDMIAKASIDGNTLKLWKLSEIDNENPSLSFSKAVTLSGAWDNGNFPLTINATQANGGTITNVGSKSIGFTNASDFYLTIEKNGDPSAFGSSRKLINVPYKIVHHGGTGVGDQDRFIGSLAAIDATSVYNNGWDDVALNDPDWQYPAANHNSDNTTASNSVVVKASNKSDGSVRQKAIPIALTVDTANKKAKVTAGGYVRAIANIDMKTNAEYNTAVANAGYAGRAAVTISSTLSWGTTPASNISATQNSFTVSTAGRTTSSGTIQQDTETFNLYSQVSTNGLDATFTVTIGDSQDGSRIIKRTVTCTVPSTYILKTSVTAGISDISWDSTNKYFYGYGYAYTGSSSPQDTTSKKTSSKLSIGDDSWSNGTKKVWVKHGTSEILSDTVSLPAVSDTYWENTTGNTWRTRITIGGAYRYSSTKTFTPNYYNDDSFDSTAAETSVQVNGHYNNSDGYYISSDSRNADVQINVKGTWTHGGGSETHYSWIEGAAGRLYRRGYDNGASGGASHAITSFDTTNASTSETYNNLTNNSDGYYISGTGIDANAYIVTKSTWKCDGQDKSALSYLKGAPTSLYHEAFMRGWANYYDDPDWWEEPSSSNGNKCYIPNRSRTGKVLWFTVSSSGSNYTSLGSGWYYTVTPLSNGKYKHSFVLEMAANSYKGLKNGTNYTLYK